ncbi:ribonuclease P protein component [Nocardioides dongxiaopingii]|uniref:ribonuclease P protein component n=1 Tax=Nocardioides sp. S-1144 TaxID=2582905 RepID=UPI001165BF94|nr:ribonuclease P protein component [Nocardioides sp. S-1144]QDH11226.1 ribonuclease P protein component [Nocardioides sp. S-1144]
MLPAAHRLTDAASFRDASRRGRRASSPRLVTHLWVDEGAGPVGVGDPAPARVGFVVSKAVGNSVVRNRVQRRLRHLSRPWVATLPPSSVLVVRALPAAAAASYDELGDDLTRCLRRSGAEGRVGP